jgi:phosphatidate cytidylyltransferase
MLKQRMITGLLLIGFFIWDILTFTSFWVGLLFAFVTMIAAWEWAKLCGWREQWQRWSYAAAILLGLLCLFLLYQQARLMTVSVSLGIALIFWLYALYWVVQYQQGRDLLPNSVWVRSALGGVLFLPTWLSLYQLHLIYSGGWLLLFLGLIWSGDTGAYAAGRLWGRHKLAYRVSPGKTWEGIGGAVVTAVLIGSIFGWFWFNQTILATLLFMLLCVLTVLISVLGDLLESLFKRKMNVKDSSRILPGHGGVLDRVDSLTSATPFFLAGLFAMEAFF